MGQFNCGQKWGLVSLTGQVKDEIVRACAQKVDGIWKLPNVRSKLNTLFTTSSSENHGY